MAVQWTEHGASSANSAVTVSHAAVTDRRHYLTDLVISVRGATSGNDVKVEIEDDTTVIQEFYLDAVRGVAYNHQYAGNVVSSPGNKLQVVVAAAGTSALVDVNMSGYTAH